MYSYTVSAYTLRAMRGDTTLPGRFKMDDNDERSVYNIMCAYLK